MNATTAGHTLRCIMLTLSLSGAAFAAEPSAQERETARRLMDEADTKAAAKDDAAASTLYQKAHAIMHVPTTGLELARSYERLGRLVESRDVALEVTRMPRAANESEAFGKARDEAAKLASSLASRVATLVLDVSGPTNLAEVRLTVDGTLVPESLRGVGWAIDPGKHVVEASAPGYKPARNEVLVAEGAKLPVPVRLVADGSAKVEPPVPAPSSPKEAPTTVGVAPVPTQPSSGITTPTIAVLAAGGAFLVAGSIVGGIALSKASTLKSQCDSSGRCPAGLQSDLSSARTTAWISNIGLGLGVIGVGIGAVLLYSDLTREPTKAARVRPVFNVSPTGGYAGITSTF